MARCCPAIELGAIINAVTQSSCWPLGALKLAKFGLQDTQRLMKAKLDDRNVLRAFDGLLTAAKLPKIRIHDLHHTCVSLLAAQGATVKTISEIIGHTISA